MNTILPTTPKNRPNYHVNDTRMVSDIKDTYDRHLETKQLRMELARCQDEFLDLSLSNRAKKSERRYTPDKKDKRSDFYRSAVKGIMDELRSVDNTFYSANKMTKRDKIDRERHELGMPSLLQQTPKHNKPKQVRFAEPADDSENMDSIRTQQWHNTQYNSTIKSKFNEPYQGDILDSFNNNPNGNNLLKPSSKANTNRISEFNPGYRSAYDLHKDRKDNMRDQKFEEKKKRFENYMLNELPGEINRFVTGFFDNNINQFKRDLNKENLELKKYVDGLKDFSLNIEEGKKRTHADLLALQNELGTMQKSELDRREGLYTALERTELANKAKPNVGKPSSFYGMNNFVENPKYINKYLDNIKFNSTLYDKNRDNHCKSACKLDGAPKNKDFGVERGIYCDIENKNRKEARDILDDLAYVLDG